MSVVKSLVVDKDAILTNVDEYWDYFITEKVLMGAVRDGGDRQELHERLREYSRSGDCFNLIQKDPDLVKYTHEAESFSGLASRQVEDFLEETNG